MAFQKAVKFEAKGRVALIGPAGAGKSWSMLSLAELLAGPGGKVAAIDTEHGSLSKYADRFNFDVIEPSSYRPSLFLDLLHEAEKEGYAVFCCDSLSHFWMGKDGALEFVDNAARRSGKGDSFSGWKEFRPHEREMVDAILASSLHVIVTMRTKNEYVEEINERGKKVRRKIGLAPVQREGLEYEFDLVGLMDEDNTFLTDKTRCPFYAQKAISKPAAKDFAPFVEWLKGSPAPAKPAPVAAPVEQQEPPIDIGDAQMNTREAAKAVAQKKLDQGFDKFAMLRKFQDQKKRVGDTEYYRVLKSHGVDKSNEINQKAIAIAIYKALEVLPSLPEDQQVSEPVDDQAMEAAAIAEVA